MAEKFWCRFKSIGLRNPWLVAEPRFLARYGFLLMIPIAPCTLLFALGLIEAFPILVVQLFFLGAYTAIFNGRFDNDEKIWAVALLVFTFVVIIVGIVSDLFNRSLYHSFTLSLVTCQLLVVFVYKIAFLCRVIARCQKRCTLRDHAAS